MRNKLLEYNEDSQVIEAVLTELAELNLQNDLRFAENFTHMRIRKGLGAMRIMVELQKKGVGQEVIKTALNQDESFWLEQAEKARRKKFGSIIPNERKKQISQFRFLQQRGFNHEQIKKILQTATLEIIE